MRTRYSVTEKNLVRFITEKCNAYNRHVADGSSLEKLKELTDEMSMLQEMIGRVLGEPLEHSLQIFYENPSSEGSPYSHYWKFALLDGEVISFDIPMGA